MKKDFGDVLKEIRIDRGYSQHYVAEGIMGQSAYSKIERSEMEPSFRKWLAILEKLNVSVLAIGMAVFVVKYYRWTVILGIWWTHHI